MAPQADSATWADSAVCSAAWVAREVWAARRALAAWPLFSAACWANNGSLGGLGGLVSKFEQAGMGDKVNSWVGAGENAPVSEGEVGDALGGDTISNLAGKLGISAATLLPLLAALLPSLIDKLTPHGTAPAQGLGDEQDLMGSLSDLLKPR